MGEQRNGCQGIKMVGVGLVGGDECGYKIATEGILVVMELFCILTTSMSISCL